MLKEWRDWSRKVAEAAVETIGKVEVYVFGSVARGEATGGSDIDLLVVAQRLPASTMERARLRLKIEEEADLPKYHPFEIHLVTHEESQLYFKHIDKYLIIPTGDSRL